MAMSLNALKKLTKEELSNMLIDYQNKFDNMLSSINAELTSLRDRFTKMESQLLVTRRVNDNLVKQNGILERMCAENAWKYREFQTVFQIIIYKKLS